MPSEAVTFSGARGLALTLRNPVLTAAGCFGDGTRFARAEWLRQLGAVVTHSITMTARRGWPLPRIAETAAGLLYATGLPNPGLRATLRYAAPVWSGLDTAVIVSIAGDSLEEYIALAIELESVPGVVALELNLEWPISEANEKSILHPATVAQVTEGVAAATSLPVLVKLSPAFFAVEAALAAQDAGADGVTVGHGWPGLAVEPNTGRDLFSGRETLLAGPAILPLSLAVVAEVVAAVEIGVIGCGGITSAATARQYFAVGARAVQVGSVSFRNPACASEIAAAISGPSASPPAP